MVEVDESILPEEYFVPQPSKPIGKPELKKAIKSGKVIPGVKLVRKEDTLQIK